MATSSINVDFSTYPDGRFTDSDPWSDFFGFGMDASGGLATGFFSGDAVYTDPLSDPYSFVEIHFGSALVSGLTYGIFIRATSTDGATAGGYYFRVTHTGTADPTLTKLPAQTDISSSSTSQSGSVTALRLEARGTTIKGYMLVSSAWVEVISGTDATFASAGYSGFSMDGFSPPGTVSTFSSGNMIYNKSGLGVMGISVHDYAKTGSDISTLVGSGSKATTSVETGLGVTNPVGSGGMTHTVTKTGSATMGVPNTPKTGLGIATWGASGSAGKTLSKTGSGISAKEASGFKGFTYNKSGGKAGGSGTPTYGLLSLSFPGGLKASGAKQVIVGNTTYSKTGAGVTAYTAFGPRSVLSIKTGIGISVRTANGPDVVQSTETGSVVSTYTASGFDNTTFSEANIIDHPMVANGADANTYVETGLGALTLVASGTGQKPGTTSASGSGVTTLGASGAKQNVDAEAGSSVSPQAASGSRSMVFTKTGAGITIGIGSGSRMVERVRTGSGITARVSFGSEFKDQSHTGVVISALGGGGLRNSVQSTSGLIELRLQASGSKSIITASPIPVQSIGRIYSYVGGSRVKSWRGRRQVSH